MKPKEIKRAIISGGGTGGHIFPALSIANALKRRYPDIEIQFVGANDRMEMTKVPEAGYPIIGLPVSGFDRKHLLRNIKVMLRLWKAMRMARKLVRNFKPDIAVGVGGYCSGPTLKAAQKAGVPTIIQEQNSYAGVTNKLLAAKADAICVAYDGMERFFPANRIHLTGNPVRKDLTECSMSQAEAKAALGFDPQRRLVLVVGGSLGARTINESIEGAMDHLIQAGIQVLWQTGRYDAERWAKAAAGSKDVHATVFITDMAVAYRAADIVVARAGAGTISELQLLGKPSILVPSPNVAEDHQRKNAEALAGRDAAVMILDSDARTRLCPAILELIGDSSRCDLLAANIKGMALTDADEKITDIIADTVEKRR